MIQLDIVEEGPLEGPSTYDSLQASSVPPNEPAAISNRPASLAQIEMSERFEAVMAMMARLGAGLRQDVKAGQDELADRLGNDMKVSKSELADKLGSKIDTVRGEQQQMKWWGE